MKNIKDLPKDSRLFYYTSLSNGVKVIARQEIITSDKFFFSRDLKVYSSDVKSDLNSAINHQKIKHFVNRKKHITKISNDVNYCEMYIVNNLCKFTIDGEYITHSLNF